MERESRMIFFSSSSLPLFFILLAFGELARVFYRWNDGMTQFCWDLRWSLIGKGLKVYDCCCELGNGNGFDCGGGRVVGVDVGVRDWRLY